MFQRVEALAAPVDPRLPAVLRSIAALEPAALELGWAATVARFAA